MEMNCLRESTLGVLATTCILDHCAVLSCAHLSNLLHIQKGNTAFHLGDCTWQATHPSLSLLTSPAMDIFTYCDPCPFSVSAMYPHSHTLGWAFPKTVTITPHFVTAGLETSCSLLSAAFASISLLLQFPPGLLSLVAVAQYLNHSFA